MEFHEIVDFLFTTLGFLVVPYVVLYFVCFGFANLRSRARSRRTSERQHVDLTEVVLAHAETPKDLFQGWIMDLSQGGLRMSVCQSIPLGTLLLMKPTSALEDAPWIKIKVKTSFQELNYWNLGCQFLKPPSLEVLGLLGYKHLRLSVWNRCQQAKQWLPKKG